MQGDLISAFFRRIFHHLQVGRVLALIYRHSTMDASALQEVGFVRSLSPKALGKNHEGYSKLTCLSKRWYWRKMIGGWHWLEVHWCFGNQRWTKPRWSKPSPRAKGWVSLTYPVCNIRCSPFSWFAECTSALQVGFLLFHCPCCLIEEGSNDSSPKPLHKKIGPQPIILLITSVTQ